MYLPELLCVLVLMTYICDVRSDKKKPPEGFSDIPQALTMESFEDHVRKQAITKTFYLVSFRGSNSLRSRILYKKGIRLTE